VLFSGITTIKDQQSQLQDPAITGRGQTSLHPHNRSWHLTSCVQGGFSYVYLVQDTSTSQLYALKKIRCPFGQESVSQALKEVEAYTLFSPHPNIIHNIDHCVSSSKDKSDPGAKTVYILLPYYSRGNIQDAINANLVNHTKFSERRLMVLFLGVARALKAMHQYRVKGGPGGPQAQRKARGVRQEAAEADEDAARKAQGRKGRRNKSRERDQEDIEQEPLMEGEVTTSQDGVAEGEIRAYAHRDVKPGRFFRAPRNGRWLMYGCRQHHDRGRRQDSDLDGPRLSRSFANSNNISLYGTCGTRYRRRTLYNAISRA